MIGTWVDSEVDSDENSSLFLQCRWSTNQNFLLRSFKLETDEGGEFEGTEVIGWDPTNQTIRSWLFDSDGGFGAGRWSQAGTRWTVQSVHVLPDGRKASATNIYELVDDGSVDCQSIGRQVDGELLPSVGPFKVVRSDSE
jgi:hypothetical protein